MATDTVWAIPGAGGKEFTTDEEQAREWHDKGYLVSEVTDPTALTIDKDGVEEYDPEPSFHEYLCESVFTEGSYVFDRGVSWGDIGVSEYDDGHGHIHTKDMQQVKDDPNVEIVTVNDGRLILEDRR